MSALTRVTLWVIVVSLAAWGVALLLVPDFIWGTLHGAHEVSPAYSRYGGAWFLGVAVAAWAALRNSLDERPVLLITFIGATLSAVALLVDLLADELPGPDEWIVWLAILDAAALGVLSYLALREAGA